MKTLFVSAKADYSINEKELSSFNLPKKLAIAYSIQYKSVAEKIKKILSKTHTISNFVQVLGCSNPKFSKNPDAILLVSSGKFHASSLALESGLPIYIYESGKLAKISEDEIKFLRKRKKSAYLNFLSSDKIGILISTKPGQENLKKAISLKSSIKNKDSYLFICNEINPCEFENFSEIKSWVNTACPRLDFDNPIINMADLNFGNPKNIL